MDDNRFEVFDGEQKKVLMDMQAEILKAREARETDMFGLDVSEQERQDRSHLAKVRDIWKRGGRLPGASDRLSIDAL
ncbi:MAG: hypothetical protein KDH96_12025, partial [Candidatus Riesia sp.]|nr:hypothetical protein [Candidatus Riesia sp.]